jgi:hypothetical protein
MKLPRAASWTEVRIFGPSPDQGGEDQKYRACGQGDEGGVESHQPAVVGSLAAADALEELTVVLGSAHAENLREPVPIFNPLMTYQPLRYSADPPHRRSREGPAPAERSRRTTRVRGTE